MRPTARTASSGPGWSSAGSATSSPWPATRRSPASAGTSRADVLAAHAPEQAWKRRSCGDGRQRPRACSTGRSPRCRDAGTAPPGWSRWLLVRRSLTRNTKASSSWPTTCAAPRPEPTDEELIRVAGSRWAVEECFQTAKNETGLDHYQVRRYDAWYRHITLAMLAHAYLAVTAATAPKALAAASSQLTLGEVRRLLAHLITTVPGRAAAWAWSRWRRRHQHRAKTSHYQRRQAKYNEVLLEY